MHENSLGDVQILDGVC